MTLGSAAGGRFGPVGKSQPDQNLVSSLPNPTSQRPTPDRSKSQSTPEKNHRFRPGAISSTSRIMNPYCLTGSSARWVAGLRCDSSAA
jgi:hypothetical protein